MWMHIWRVVQAAGPGLVGELFSSLRAGDGKRAAYAARIVAETVAMREAQRAARRGRR